MLCRVPWVSFAGMIHFFVISVTSVLVFS
uniref:Uncharacterized protein n=1 Tax=Rhizophora mucronata TaxID=61149 RepID=A0A2P2NW16_RHIMU